MSYGINYRLVWVLYFSGIIFLIISITPYVFKNIVQDSHLSFGSYQEFFLILLSYFSSTYLILFSQRFIINLISHRNYQSSSVRTEIVDNIVFRISILVPAYNEEAHICKTLGSIVQANYPKDFLEIWCIDDGSIDATWSEIIKFKENSSIIVHTIRLKRNKGKKFALAQAIQACTGELIITVDADSCVDPNAFSYLVRKIQSSPNIGAVAGKIEVILSKNLWTRIFSVIFDIAFGFYRAAESTYGMVLCCPGALSAYRRDLVIKSLDTWLSSTFWSIPNLIGEDRTLTNEILAKGKYTAYEEDAVCYTHIPTIYKGLVGMLLRWQRSNFREHLRGFRMIFSRDFYKVGRLTGSINLLVYGLGEFCQALLWPLCFICALFVPLLILKIFIWLLIHALICSLLLVYPRNSWLGVKRFWVYVFTYFFLFSWIVPWALVTVFSNKWGKKFR